MQLVLVALAATFVVCSCTKKLPPDFKICKRKDPNISECMKAAVADALPKLDNGIKDLGTAPLQPLNVPSVTIGEGKGAVHVKQVYKNLDMYNIGQTTIQKMNAVIDDVLDIHIVTLSPETRLEADYDFNGRILLLPIVGNGRCTIKLLNVTTEMFIKSERLEKKGVVYNIIKEFKITLTPTKVTYNFENLFNGDAVLGAEMNKVLNENWKEVFEDVKAGYEEFIGSIGKHYANTIFSKIPYDDMFPL